MTSTVRIFVNLIDSVAKEFSVLHQSPPHPATRFLLWTSISCESQATSCRVCCGMASAPAADGSADLSVILSDAGWNKGFSVRKKESWCSWTVGVYAHGSHGKGRHTSFCGFLKQGVPRWSSWASDFTLVLAMLILLPDQCVGRWPDGLSGGNFQTWSVSLSLSFSSVSDWVLEHHCFPVLFLI